MEAAGEYEPVVVSVRVGWREWKDSRLPAISTGSETAGGLVSELARAFWTAGPAAGVDIIAAAEDFLMVGAPPGTAMEALSVAREGLDEEEDDDDDADADGEEGSMST